MNKKSTIIAVVAVAVLAVIGIVVAMNLNKDTSKSEQTNTSNSTKLADPAKEFSPQALDSLAYVATSKMTVSGQTITGTTESDGKGTQKTTSETAGMKSESYITGDTVVTCMNGQCSKTTVSAADKEASAALTSDLSKYKDSATNAGTGDCPAGTCQVWKANGPSGEVSYYIDSQNRISKIALGDGNMEMTYDYKDVSITVPSV